LDGRNRWGGVGRQAKKKRVRNSASSKGLLVARASDPSPAHAANIGRGAAQRAVCSPPARNFYSKWSESDRPSLHYIYWRLTPHSTSIQQVPFSRPRIIETASACMLTMASELQQTVGPKKKKNAIFAYTCATFACMASVICSYGTNLYNFYTCMPLNSRARSAYLCSLQRSL